MPELYHFDDDTGAAFTGTSLTSLVGSALPEIPANTALVRERIEFDVVYDFLNITGAKQSHNFDFYIAGTFAARLPLYAFRSHVDTRQHRITGILTITSATEALLVASAFCASAAVADDERQMSLAKVIPFNIALDQTIDFRVTLSVADIDTLKITPVDINIDKILYGVGDGSNVEVLIPPDVVRCKVEVGGIYQSPTGGYFPAPLIYLGLTRPDATNNPGVFLVNYDKFWPSTAT